MLNIEIKLERDPKYTIDCYGRVYSYKSGNRRELSQKFIKKRGYVVYINKSGVSVQLLMAETFLKKNDPEDNIVIHLDGDRTNNHISNISWSSNKKESIKDIPKALDIIPESNSHEVRICEIHDDYIELEGYTITPDGSIYSYIGGCKKKINPNSDDGYMRTILGSRNTVRKAVRVHRLVALAFIPNDDPSKDQINHIDGDKTNNSVDNLEWSNNSENQRHALVNGLKETRAISVYNLDGSIYKTYPSAIFAIEDLNIPHRSSVYRCLAGEQSQAYGYIWKYLTD